MSLVGNTPLQKNAMNHHGVKEAFFDTFFQKKATAQLSADAYTHSISENFSRFSFTGKERDEETGYGYFGARYMDHELMTMWLSVDPMADKYPSISPYAYCAWNPVKLVDPNGEFPIPIPKKFISKSITSSAEYAHNLYCKAASIIQNHPLLISMVNDALYQISNGVEMVTDMNPHTMGWIDLANIWLFELGNKQKYMFSGNDNTTKQLMQQEGVNQARELAHKNIKNNNYEEVNHPWNYRETQFYEGIRDGNEVTSFLGSYTTSVKISPGTKEGEYILIFEVNNTSGWESATRLRKGHKGIIPNKKRGEGIHLGGNVSQTWRWTETYNVKQVEQ